MNVGLRGDNSVALPLRYANLVAAMAVSWSDRAREDIMSIAAVTASDIFAGRTIDSASFSIADFDIAEAADRIDALVSPDPERPRYMRGDVAAGWYRLLAIAVEASCRRAGTEPTAKITLMQCKEKFGELRLLFAVEGSTELKTEIETITTWARSQSTSVCAAYGTPARMTRDGWIIPLSKEAIALRARDRMAFRQQTAAPARS